MQQAYGSMIPPYYPYVFPGQFLTPMAGQTAPGDMIQGVPGHYPQMQSPEADPNQQTIQPPFPYPVFIQPPYGYPYPPSNVGIPFSPVGGQSPATNLPPQNQPPPQQP